MRWPADLPLAAIWGDGLSPWSQWIVLAKPTGEISNELPSNIAAPGLPDDAGPPFRGGWIGAIDYEHGHVIEPAVGANTDYAPTVTMLRCDSGLACHVASGTWWRFGDEIPLTEAPAATRETCAARGFRIGPVVAETERRDFEATVARVIEYIHAGDVFQVNLTHRLRAAMRGSSRELFAALVAGSAPRHGAFVELPQRTLVSASPELLLDFDPRSRLVVTRPMKGTRPGGADPGELISSDKDQAELNMIIDLMRNDLGRVCEFGSVRVVAGRQIERHGGEPGVLQSVATIEGRVRDGVGLQGIVRAVFPAGSITGAPKIRAMQIINELERRRRGAYCGAIGFIGDDGAARFSVAIRTATITGDRLHFDVGAGIVAESDPASEWEETMVKAGVLTSLAQGGVGGCSAARTNGAAGG